MKQKYAANAILFSLPGRVLIPDDCLLVPRFGPPGHQQLLPDQVQFEPRTALLHVDDGAPPFRPMPHDTQLQGQPDPRKLISG